MLLHCAMYNVLKEDLLGERAKKKEAAAARWVTWTQAARRCVGKVVRMTVMPFEKSSCSFMLKISNAAARQDFSDAAWRVIFMCLVGGHVSPEVR